MGSILVKAELKKMPTDLNSMDDEFVEDDDGCDYCGAERGDAPTRARC